MMRSAGLALAFSCMATLATAQATQPLGQLTVRGADGAAHVLTRDSLARLPQEEVRGRIHDGPELVFRGPALAAVIALTGTSTDLVRGKALRLVVFAQARDDYAVAYSLGEASPGLSGRRIIVALTQDGKPLDAETGPMRMVVEGDLRQARWIRQLDRLAVVEVGAP